MHCRFLSFTTSACSCALVLEPELALVRVHPNTASVTTLRMHVHPKFSHTCVVLCPGAPVLMCACAYAQSGNVEEYSCAPVSVCMCLLRIQSEAVAALCEVLQEGSVDLDQQAASIFSALARIPEGREALLSQGALTPLAELLESGETAACREHAVTALLGLAMNNRGCLWQIDELGITMALDVLSRSENIPLQAKVRFCTVL